MYQCSLGRSMWKEADRILWAALVVLLAAAAYHKAATKAAAAASAAKITAAASEAAAVKRKAEESAASNYEAGMSATCAFLYMHAFSWVFAAVALSAAFSALPVACLVSAAAAYLAYYKGAAAASVSRAASEAAAQAAAAEQEAAAAESFSVLMTMTTRCLGCATIALAAIYSMRIGSAVVLDLLWCWLR